MIPKPLNEIEWSDLEALRDSGREEDDTIEFKGSFSGGSDFLTFNDKQQASAVDGIAKEAIAFLNGRGGDIVIGAKEFKNEHPKIEALTPLPNVVQTVDRLAQALAAVIEPTQSILGVRAVTCPEIVGSGAIVVRVQSSLRAPHRSRRTRECYVRRGRESVPMPMDEVQDVTLSRAMMRSERNLQIDRQFASLRTGQIGTLRLPLERAHIRIVFVPNSNSEIELNESQLRCLFGYDPVMSNAQRSFKNDIAFGMLGNRWRHELRGRRIERYSETGDSGFQFCAKAIKTSGLMLTEFASRYLHKQQDKKMHGQAIEWIQGFLANSLHSIREVFVRNPQFAGGTIRIGHYCGDGWYLLMREGRFFEDNQLLQPGLTEFPDFEVEDADSFNETFRQAQVDFASLAGLDCPNPFNLPPLS